MRHIAIASLLLSLLTSCVPAPQQPPATSNPDPVVAWRETVNTEINQLIAAHRDMDTHFTRYYKDAAAREAVERDMDTIQQTHQRLQRLLIPDTRVEVHNRLLDATSDCNSGIDAYREALRTDNQSNTAPTGKQLIDRCLTKLVKLTKKELRV